MRHMRSIHPDFQLQKREDGGFQILWKKKLVGHTRPLAELTPSRGQSCFIVGTGPSISGLDLSRLKNHPCFGVNGSILKSSEIGSPFIYYVITDRNFFLDRFDLVRRVVRSDSDCLFSFRGLGAICEQAPEVLSGTRLFLLDEVNAHYGQSRMEPNEFEALAAQNSDFELHARVESTQGRVGFSRDIRQGVFTGQTVVFSALQTACWLGYKRIFIVGMDLGGTGHNVRFYESGKQAASMRLDNDYESFILPAFEVARNLMGATDVEIYNLSPHSRLPDSVIPKLSLTEALRMAETGRTN